MDGDDEFLDSHDITDEQHAKCNKDWDWNGFIFLYVYILYGRSAPHFVTRDQVTEMCLDVGVSGDKVVGGSAKKRTYTDINQDKLIAALTAPIVIEKDPIEKTLMNAQINQMKQQAVVAQGTIQAAKMVTCEKQLKLLTEWIGDSTDDVQIAEWKEKRKKLQEEILKF